ncbi:MAG: hypothetical protein LBT12_08315 [Oscillospiraceae bacterium]|jgi:hypothetical protein|nr:hypothetical protein [Oscillospiraceae bacterium]
MSIKGIDAQIMVARTTEYVRETDHQMRRNELMQDYLNVQGKLANEAEGQNVIKTVKAEASALHLDEKGADGGGDGAEGAPRDRAEAEEEEERFSDGEPHMLDIVI